MKKTICVWGDSIIWGAFLPFRGAWINLLRNYLESLNEMIAVYDLGIDGNTTFDLLKRFEPEAEARKPDVILFAIGVNDSAYRKTKSNPLVTEDEFKINLEKLIALAQKFTREIFFVGLGKGDDSKTVPLPRSTTGKCYDKENIRIYDGIIRSVCSEKGVVFIDVFNHLNDEDFDDGLHPNLGGHQKIFEAVRRVLIKNLNLVD